MQRLIKFGPVVLEEKIFRRWQSVFSISKLLLLGGRAWSSFEQTWILFTLGWFTPCLVEIDPVVLEEKIFKSVNVFLLCHNNVPLGSAWSFVWINKNHLYPWMLCAKFGWNWPSGSGEDENGKNVYRLTDRRQMISKAHF